MAWDKTDTTVTFECDTCDTVVDCDIKTLRAASPPTPHDSDFIVCYRHMQGIGWRSFKRTDRPWSYHCPECGPQAEMDHREYRRNERQREAIKARNG